MKNVNAIICELNPLHKGHEHLINSARSQSDVLVLIMSGSFTQRSNPAVFDKYDRARAAISCGADLVVELPFPWCTYGVEGFARGGVKTAASIGVNGLFFGSESGDIDSITKLADIKSSEEFAEKMRELDRNMRSTGSGELFDRTVKELGLTHVFGANEKLGAEYIRFGRLYGIENFRTVKRLDGVMSASDIREKTSECGKEYLESVLSERAWKIFEKSDMCSEKEYEKLLFSFARLSEKGEEQIVNHAITVALASKNPDEFIKNIPSKKYTLSRVKRHLLHTMIKSPLDDGVSVPDFTYLLAANKTGVEYLNSVKKTCEINIITKPADGKGNTMKESLRADEIFLMCSGKESSYLTKMKPYIEK